MKNLLFFTIILVAMSSCTITKQRYSKGFHAEWRKRMTMNREEANSTQIDSDNINTADGIQVRTLEEFEIDHVLVYR